MLESKQQLSNKIRNRRWTERENEALRQGILKFGVGQWKKIKESAGDVLDHRSNVDLKDRYRNIQSVRDRIVKLMHEIPVETASKVLVSLQLDSLSSYEFLRRDVEHLHWDLLPEIERTMRDLQESEHKRIAFKNISSQQNIRISKTGNTNPSPPALVGPDQLVSTESSASVKPASPRSDFEVKQQEVTGVSANSEMDELPKRRDWIDENIFVLSPGKGKRRPCLARRSDIHQLQPSPRTSEVTQRLQDYSESCEVQGLRVESSEDEEVEFISGSVSTRHHCNTTGSSNSRSNKPERFYCGYIHELVLYAGNNPASTRQVRNWLLTHSHLCPVDNFTECDIDHIVPRSLGGHDHPYNYYIMPTSMNKKFNKWMTKGSFS